MFKQLTSAENVREVKKLCHFVIHISETHVVHPSGSIFLQLALLYHLLLLLLLVLVFLFVT